MTTIPTLASFASGWLDALEPEYYRNIAPKYYHTPRRYQHADHPLHCIVIPSFNAIQKNKEEKKCAVPLIGNDGFQVCMDVEHFKPSELTVKTVDNCIVVEGKHEEIPDEHGFISRSFVRRYILPDGYDPQQTVSTLSSDGILTIKVPQPQKTQSNERIVHIQQTGPAHLTVKDNKEEKDGKEQKKEKK